MHLKQGVYLPSHKSPIVVIRFLQITVSTICFPDTSRVSSLHSLLSTTDRRILVFDFDSSVILLLIDCKKCSKVCWAFLSKASMQFSEQLFLDYRLIIVDVFLTRVEILPVYQYRFTMIEYRHKENSHYRPKGFINEIERANLCFVRSVGDYDCCPFTHFVLHYASITFQSLVFGQR